MANEPTPPANPKDAHAGVAILIAVVLGLIGCGFLPPSCGKMLPVVGRHFAHYCDACGGDGKVRDACPTCHGHGYSGGTRCVTCGGAGKVEHVCRYCNGSGQKPAR
ncbi:hypothetical protein [Fimbriiglobus ruber]|uniref:Chaperone protein DnaJ n=1 Tax=Fimbriiglobus ruber TaxID=1908690 RepID=A0A225D0Z8_9BACT|nr:hypothetical protein [Fimbriiglobus ruber]OWK35280.1 hypothetical protein FRUB_09441 [Fimbriiglobus ruber]